jgi:DNA-binding GntR family transcriptional regulator
MSATRSSPVQGSPRLDYTRCMQNRMHAVVEPGAYAARYSLETEASAPSASGTSVEAVVAAMRASIRRQELLPGEQVRQNDWALRVGVSRVPVREALNSLALAGVLTHDPHRGFFLTKYSQAEIAQLYWVRGAIEVEIVRTLDWPSATEMRTLKKMAVVMQDAAKAGDAAGWLEAHDEFHSMILSLSPIKVLVEEAERLWIRTESFRSMRIHNTLGESHAENLSHAEILDALQKRDRERLVGLFTNEMQIRESDLTEWATRRVP